jgi:hypothetical protein
VYSYDEVSGRLVSVTDTVPEPDVVHQFAWNPEGTLARWEEPNSYARVFGYDEEGRLVKIERDYGSGGVQAAYEYGYNSDGACMEARVSSYIAYRISLDMWNSMQRAIHESV